MNTFLFIVTSFDCLMAMYCGITDQWISAIIWLACGYLVSLGIKDKIDEI